MIKYTELKRAVTKGLINPKKEPYFKVLADVDSKDYYMHRAIECLRTAMLSDPEPFESPLLKAIRHDKIDKELEKAILCIALARIKNDK